jgi:hypothetical protein
MAMITGPIELNFKRIVDFETPYLIVTSSTLTAQAEAALTAAGFNDDGHHWVRDIPPRGRGYMREETLAADLLDHGIRADILPGKHTDYYLAAGQEVPVEESPTLERPTTSAFLSTTVPGTQEALDLNEIIGAAQHGSCLHVVTGYLTTDWLKIVVPKLGHVELRIHVNAAELLRSKELAETLTNYLLTQKKRLRVWLHDRPGGLFHAKLYLVEGPTGMVAWVGSANATEAAFSKNEEILVRMGHDGGPILRSMCSYLNSLEARGTRFVGAERPRISSLEALFLSGKLYFERPWKSRWTLPIKTHPDLAKTTRGVGPRPPGLEQRDSNSFALTSFFNLRTMDKASFKPLVVPTCFGFWAPDEFSNAIKERQAKKRNARVALMNRLWELGLAAGRGRIEAGFHEVLTSIYPEWRDPSFQRDWGYNPTTRLNSFLERLYGKEFGRRAMGEHSLLSPGAHREKLAEPLFEARLPGIFEYRAARRAFLESFFDALSIESDSSIRLQNNNRVWRDIAKHCGLRDVQHSPGEIQEALERSLQSGRELKWTAPNEERPQDEDEGEDEV